MVLPTIERSSSSCEVVILRDLRQGRRDTESEVKFEKSTEQCDSVYQEFLLKNLAAVVQYKETVDVKRCCGVV